jgi:nitrate reductase assembly molybdenum cofactor insertion protein NarJ
MKMNITDKNEARHKLANAQNELTELNRMFSKMDFAKTKEELIDYMSVMSDYATLAKNKMEIVQNKIDATIRELEEK